MFSCEIIHIKVLIIHVREPIEVRSLLWQLLQVWTLSIILTIVSTGAAKSIRNWSTSLVLMMVCVVMTNTTNKRHNLWCIGYSSKGFFWKHGLSHLRSFCSNITHLIKPQMEKLTSTPFIIFAQNFKTKNRDAYIYFRTPRPALHLSPYKHVKKSTF